MGAYTTPRKDTRFPRATLQLPRKQKPLPVESSAVAFPAGVSHLSAADYALLLDQQII